MDFDLIASNKGSTRVLTVCGDVDVYTAPILDAHIQEAINSGSTSIAIDLAKCCYFDSEGIKVLLRAQRMLKSHGGIVVVGAAGSVRRVFEISGLGSLFPILPSLQDLAEA